MRWAQLALLFALGALGAWQITRAPLPALSPDSASYLGAAEALLQGEGLRIPMAKWWSAHDTEPLRHFPPGYPLLLALTGSLGVPALLGARVIQALAAGGVLALAAHAAGAVAGVAGALLAGLLLVASAAVVQDFLPVLSEPLFLCLVLGLVTLLAAERERPLALTCVCVAGLLVRYAGISLLVTVLVREALRAGPIAPRVRRAAIVALPTLLTLWGWRQLSGEFRRYQLVLDGLPTEAARALRTLSAWAAPGFPERSVLPLYLGVPVLAALAFALGRAHVRAPGWYDPALQRLVASAVTFSACYAAVVLGSRCLADHGIEFDWRTLSPLIALADLVLAAALAAWLRSASAGPRALAGALAALWLCGASIALHQLLWKARHVGYAYEAPRWQRSGLAAWLRRSTALTLYTNNPAALYLIAQRRSRFLPMTHEGDVTARFQRVFARRPSALVIFPNDLADTVDPDALAARLGLAPARQFDRGRVWLSTSASQRPKSVTVR